MKPRLLNLEVATASVRPFLPQYLQEHGIDTTKNFRCIDPKHEDKDASMSMKQNPENAWCYGCNRTCDILTAAHLLEGKPIKGYGFIEDNLMYLAKKYGVQLELADLSEEEIYEYKTYEAYALAAKLVADPKFGDYTLAAEEIKNRGWDLDRVSHWGIGTVNFKDFRERLKQAGYEAGFLNSIDLDRSNLFNEDNLLFTVYDENGRPVGFSARNLKYKKEDKQSGPKYNNTRVTGLECNIFRKGERLYGLDIAKDAGAPLYIFEGQADVISARHFGYANCVCTLGSALTDHHIHLLKKYGLFGLVLVFDADQGGEEAIQKILDEKLSPHKEFRVKLIQLPQGMDPDQLFREKGAEEFARVKRWDAFEWRLAQFPDETDPEEIAKLTIPIILADKNYLSHEKRAKILAKRTGFDLATIMSEIKRQRSEREAEVAEKVTGIIENALWEAKRNPDDAGLLLTEAQANVAYVQKEFGVDSMGEGSVLSFVLNQKEADEAKTNEFSGFHMRASGLGNIARRLDDDWRHGIWMCLGGVAQSGKTSCVSQMAIEIAEDERNKAIVIYHSIDDAARFILFKMICVCADSLELTLGHVANPQYWAEKEMTDKYLKLREAGYRQLMQLITDKKIIIKDASESASLSYSENLVRYYKDLLPEKNIVLIIDNFHKLPDYPDLAGHERIKRISNHVKHLAAANDCTVITTVEYRKIYDAAVPTNADIFGSGSIEYDASAVLHLHNDIHVRGPEKATYVHEWNGEILPRIRVDFGKNKISGYEGTEMLDFFPRSATMKAVDTETARKDYQARVQFLRERRTSTMP